MMRIVHSRLPKCSSSSKSTTTTTMRAIREGGNGCLASIPTTISPFPTTAERTKTLSMFSGRRWLMTAIAVAFQPQHQHTSFAFVPVVPTYHSHHQFSTRQGLSPLQQQQRRQRQKQDRVQHYSTTNRLFMSRNNSDNNNANNNDDGWFSILAPLKRAAQAILPSRWFGETPQVESNKEQSRLQRQRELKEEVSGGLNQILKGAPLPIRMLGSMITPLFSSALSSLAQAAEEQQSMVQKVLEQATLCIQQDATVQQVLGGGSGNVDSIQVSSTPFSQSTSSSSISVNGRTSQAQQRIQLAVQVVGSLDSGIATITADENGIQSIRIQTNRSGRLLQVSTIVSSNSNSSRASSFFSNNNKNDNIIEAEIIEKESNNNKNNKY